MALDKQIQIYGLDTGNFYSNREKYLHQLNYRAKAEKNKLNEEKRRIEKSIQNFINNNKLETKVYSLISDFNEKKVPSSSNHPCYELYLRYIKINSWIHFKNKIIKDTKHKIKKLLKNKKMANINSNGRHHIRQLRECDLSDRNIISVFDSALTRAIGLDKDEFTEEFMVIQVYYFDVIEDMIYYGFKYKGEKYIYFTSSAGQIRTKKTVFIKESTFNKISNKLMCGLTLDKINKLGGNNPNKHLAYTALTNSATDVWNEFDIDRSIVIDDFETEVEGTYDFIDDKDYSITRKFGKVPVPHTDGVGMMLPKMGKNRMIRLPWVKGLIAAFDFKKFIEVNNCNPIIKDIYGQERDILKENIEIIFTRSQFKCWKYYESWDSYKTLYKKYGCTAGVTNIEEDKIKNTTINYQMLQTLTDITDDEIIQLTKKSVDKLNNLTDNIDNIKSVFGVTLYNHNKTSLQKSIDIYPNLLNDDFLKDKIRSIRDSLVKKYKSGKLEVNGKYTFVLPDLYAACEYWFMNIENPRGLLKNGEIYCDLFRFYNEVDCLRSPHLYKEHAIRKNIAYDKECRKKNQEWFDTSAIYTSCFDLISKILMFDVDGDKLLVVTDKALISAAKRSAKDIVPLYYDTKKAQARELNNKSIYAGLHASFTGKDIGVYSNDISKVWNNDIFVSGNDKQKKRATEIVKLLCCENNLVIDSAKTLYLPERPKHINKEITTFTKNLLPHFFTYAKDKEVSQVEPNNGSFVNQLENIIPRTRLNFKKLGVDKPDWKMLVNNQNIKCRVEFDSKGKFIEDKTDPIIINYHKFCQEFKYIANKSISLNEDTIKKVYYSGQAGEKMEFAKYYLIIKKIKDCFATLNNNEINVCDILVKYLYHKTTKRGKAILWLCYGRQILNNLEKNLSKNRMLKQKRAVKCKDCGEWFEAKSNRSFRCETCAKEENKRRKREWKRLKF